MLHGTTIMRLTVKGRLLEMAPGKLLLNFEKANRDEPDLSLRLDFRSFVKD